MSVDIYLQGHFVIISGNEPKEYGSFKFLMRKRRSGFNEYHQGKLTQNKELTFIREYNTDHLK